MTNSTVTIQSHDGKKFDGYLKEKLGSLCCLAQRYTKAAPSLTAAALFAADRGPWD